ncbi:MAG: hypothetical protein JSW06_05670 [Thermoplasmatales archaeon]|nr:MAG: hypothetical protein JSW06_05670 [Thermoplasmatales archaeon]
MKTRNNKLLGSENSRAMYVRAVGERIPCIHLYPPDDKFNNAVTCEIPILI